MTPMTLDELRELAPVYVMGALSPDEQAAFELALRDGEIAAALEPELSAHRAAMDFLATAYATPAPAGLRERVIQRIAESSRAGTGVDGRAATGVGSSPVDTSAAPSTAAPAIDRSVTSLRPDLRVVSGDAPKRTRGGWYAAGALGAALAASLVFSIDLRNQVRSLESKLATQVTEAGRTAGSLAEREKLLATLLGTGNDVTLVRLAPGQPQGPGMQVFWNTREGRAIVSASGLAQIASNRAYALWMIRDGKPVPLALFNPDAAGRAVVQNITVPTDLAGVAAFAVTEEPAEGSPQPTMTPFLVGAVPK